MKEKSNMVILTDAEKASDKIQYPFLIKTHNRGIEGNCPHVIKATYGKPTANTIFNGEKKKAFPLRAGARQGSPLSPLLFHTVLEVPATAIKQEKYLNASKLEGKK